MSPHEAGSAPERLGDPAGNEDCAHREVAGGEPLGGQHDIGIDALRREHHAGASVARDHLVGDEQDTPLTADLAHPREVASRRGVDPARSDDGLAEEGRDVVLTDAVDRGPISDIKRHQRGVAPSPLDLIVEGFQPRDVSGEGDDMGASRGERDSRRAAEPARSAGDQRYPAPQISQGQTVGASAGRRRAGTPRSVKGVG